MNTNLTLADRLDAVLHRILPKGTPKNPAPYEFAATGDGRQLLKVRTNPETGETIAVQGKTKADLIAALEARFPDQPAA